MPKQQQDLKRHKKEKINNQTKDRKNIHKYDENSYEWKKSLTKYEVGKPLACFHIEYNLISDANKYSIDVNCWEQVAKIYAEDQSKILKIMIKDEIAWIVFSVVIHIENISNASQIKFHGHTITFNIWNSHNKQGTRAKSDKTKIFYSKKNAENLSEEFTVFEELYDTPPPQMMHSEKDSVITEETDELISSMPSFNQTTLFLSALPAKNHIKSVQDIIDNFKIDDVLLVKMPISISVEKNVGESKQKSSKKKTKVQEEKKQVKRKTAKETTEASNQFQIKAEEFFTDNAEIRGELKPVKEDLIYVTALASVENLLTIPQKLNLNPLNIRIVDLINLPFELLQEHGITKVFIKYQILGTNEITTTRHPVARTITFNEVHAILTHQFSKTKLLQFFQTELLKIELYGIRDPQVLHTINPSMFGQESYDSEISTKLLTTNKAVRHFSWQDDSVPILLAIATYDLKNLIAEHYHLELSCIMETPVKKIISHMSNFTLPMDCPFTNPILMENSTCLNIAVKITTSLFYTLRQISVMKEILNRIFLVVYDLQEAQEILIGLYEINQEVLEAPTFTTDLAKTRVSTEKDHTASGIKLSKYKKLLGNRKQSTMVLQMVDANKTFNSSKTKTNEISSKNTEAVGSSQLPVPHTKQVLTGFVVDTHDKILIFVEGQMNGALQNVWSLVMNLPREKGHLLYNSDLIFDTRLYEDFIPYGGFHIISMRVPLDIYLTNPKVFMEGNIPSSSWKVMMKFDMLLKTRTMREACQSNLFPTARSLLDFDIEFGVPLYLTIESEKTEDSRDDEDDDAVNNAEEV